MNDLEQNFRDAVLLTSLLEAIPEPVLIISADSRVVAANADARALFPALRPGELLALLLRSPDVLDAVERVRVSGDPETVSWHERVPVERIFEVKVVALDELFPERTIVLTLRDLTEAHRVERMRVDFVANASHELRTPLASLLGFVETLQGAARDDPRARDRFLVIMRDQARRMARLVEDLLSLSRIEQNLHLRPETPVDLVTVVRHVVDTLTPMALENDVTLEVRAEPEITVSGDRDELVRVAENLIENAIKYGGGGDEDPKPVEIELSTLGNQALFAVRDHGAGIAPEHLPRLTERFYRVDAGESRAKGGTGLGLAIVKHIVARHRGRLTIESRLGDGAAFRVFLPLHNNK
ncbi:MAG TPA: ATP-binding protein [Beijerinckiaceae bacterium]|nr:ATP-binding protein [Beijerinckiaceae bacterium]